MSNKIVWIGADGRPDHDFLTRQVTEVISKHLRPLNPDMAFLREMDAKDHAREIANAAVDGEWLEQSKNLEVSTKRTVKELQYFQQLSLRLSDLIDGMHKPSYERLKAEGIDVGALAAQLGEVGEFTDHALHEIDGSKIIRGRRKKHAAKMVTEAAAECFEQMTGRRATLTVAPQTAAVSGRWFEFLSTIFKVLNIDESPENQARALMEKTRQKKGI